ncbi:hypothetical protein [Flavobacterium cerinum]|uniref:6-bladed beta-propeller n=1 Tax=Flavobacterium cerinum TaxID=2502784 RepID=A0A444GS74_9FLAO|nr:hypothetical protein [Flavobacterium cerinum]RWW93788.1 hypothetical protein EPI11_14740 [Flavobacterium cerinum]
MIKYFILAVWLVGLPALAQQKPASKTKTTSSRIKTEASKPRILDAAIKENPFYFKGFSLTIHDGAADERGNHMFVGRIKALEEDEKKRDPIINKAIDLSIGFYDDHYILISTDKNFKILKIGDAHRTQVISYNSKLEKFILGCSELGRLNLDDHYVSEWQPMIVVLNLEQYGTVYDIKNDYSCYLKDFIFEEERIHVLVASEEPGRSITRDEKLEIITVDLNKFHYKEGYFPKILDPVSKIISDYGGGGRIDVSEISKVGSTYYFSASNFDQTDLKNLKNETHIYRFNGKTLEDQEDFKYFEGGYNNHNVVNINGFYANSLTENIFLATNFFGGKEMYLTKTNVNFVTKKNIEIELFDKIDTGKMVVLSNGTIVVLSQNKERNWCYSVYNSDLVFVKKIDSGLSGTYFPSKIKITNEDMVECFFYDTKKIKYDSVLQCVKVN